MNEIQVKINGAWYDVSDYSSYDDLLELGEIDDELGVPKGMDLESDFHTLKEWLELDGTDQAIVLAYYENTDTFDPDKAMEAYVGTFSDDA